VTSFSHVLKHTSTWDAVERKSCSLQRLAGTERTKNGFQTYLATCVYSTPSYLSSSGQVLGRALECLHLHRARINLDHPPNYSPGDFKNSVSLASWCWFFFSRLREPQLWTWLLTNCPLTWTPSTRFLKGSSSSSHCRLGHVQAGLGRSPWALFDGRCLKPLKPFAALLNQADWGILHLALRSFLPVMISCMGYWPESDKMPPPDPKMPSSRCTNLREILYCTQNHYRYLSRYPRLHRLHHHSLSSCWKSPRIKARLI